MKEPKKHRYWAEVTWTGNQGRGTANYRAYERDYQISINNKPIIKGSADPAFLGNPAQYNPEEFLMISLSACHLLWYLHFCSDASIVVTRYLDKPEGTMIEKEDGKGCFSEVILKPLVAIQSAENQSQAEQLHAQAHEYCFIANSVNFPVKCEPSIEIEQVS